MNLLIKKIGAREGAEREKEFFEVI